MNDTIFLNRQKVLTLIGVLPHERLEKQTLIVSLSLETDFTAAIATDNLCDTVNYAALAELVETFAAESQFQLIETFAGKLIELIWARFDCVNAVTVTIEKPNALKQTPMVGLVMRRAR